MFGITARGGRFRAAVLIGAPLLAFFFIQADGFHPVLRLNGVLANQIVGTASFLLPFVTVGYAASAPRHRFTRIVLIM